MFPSNKNIEARRIARIDAERILAGHKGLLGSLSADQLRVIAAMDEPAVLCGNLDGTKWAR